MPKPQIMISRIHSCMLLPAATSTSDDFTSYFFTLIESAWCLMIPADLLFSFAAILSTLAACSRPRRGAEIFLTMFISTLNFAVLRLVFALMMTYAYFFFLGISLHYAYSRASFAAWCLREKLLASFSRQRTKISVMYATRMAKCRNLFSYR